MTDKLSQDEFQKMLDKLGTYVTPSYGYAEPHDPPREDEIGLPISKTVTFLFSFAEKGFGFGEFCFKHDVASGQTFLDTECMSKERIKRYLCNLVDISIADRYVGVGGKTDQPFDKEAHKRYHEVMGGHCPNCEDQSTDG